ncbi:hypothetical protein [Micromonospora sp. NPDC050200]|uniref:hypothetical protein n=1 Tax=Micromonospora sp. NPDC050200 TaxID=3155664 RepID=UPI0033DC9DAE
MRIGRRVVVALTVVAFVLAGAAAAVWMFAGDAADSGLVGNANVVGGLTGLVALGLATVTIAQGYWQKQDKTDKVIEESDPTPTDPTADLTAVVVAHPTPTGGGLALPREQRNEGSEFAAGLKHGHASAGNLFSVDWRPMLGDGDGDGYEFEPTGEVRAVCVEVPLLSDWLATERSRLSAADVSDGMKSQLLRPVRRAQDKLRKLGSELSWLARAAHHARYTDAEIRLILDRALSLRVNDLLARTDYPGQPEPLELRAMAAFTLGYAEEELVELGFDAGKGDGGCVASVPRRILLESPELMAVGEALAPAGATESTKLYTACQFAQDFTFIGLADQRRLWTQFVLPQAFVRYPLHRLIVDVGRIQRFGLP